MKLVRQDDNLVALLLQLFLVLVNQALEVFDLLLQDFHVGAVVFLHRVQFTSEVLVLLADFFDLLRQKAVALVEVPVAVLSLLQACHLALVALELLRVSR